MTRPFAMPEPGSTERPICLVVEATPGRAAFHYLSVGEAMALRRELDEQIARHVPDQAPARPAQSFKPAKERALL